MLIGCNGHKTEKAEESTTSNDTITYTDEELMDSVQYQTFEYFWDGAEPTSGLARERLHLDNIYPSHDKNIITTGGSGFGLMAILVGVERKFISREQALERYEKIIDFLEKAGYFAFRSSRPNGSRCSGVNALA